MGKKNRRKFQNPAPRPTKSDQSYWKYVAIIAIILLIGVIGKTAIFPTKAPTNTAKIYQRPQPVSADPLEQKVLQVAANFKCACGGCGELPLVECTCDMPRGAVTEKRFIREKLMEGLSVEQVIQLVDELYGLRVT